MSATARGVDWTPEQKKWLIERFAVIARPMMIEFMGPNSCIAASRVTVECLRLIGIPAIPVPTKFVVQVPSIERAYAAGLTSEEMATAKTSQRIWGTGWEGHLVVFADDRYLLDPSFDAAETALALPVDHKVQIFDLGQKPDLEYMHLEMVAISEEVGQIKIQYVSTRDESYQDTEAWNDEGLPLLATDILLKMRGSR